MSSALMFSLSQEPVEGRPCLEFSVPKPRKGTSELDAWRLCGRGFQAGKQGLRSYLELLLWAGLRPTPPAWMADTEPSTLANGNRERKR